MSGLPRTVRNTIVIVALLALVGLASHAGRAGGRGGETAHVPALIGDYLATFALILLAAGAVAAGWLMIQTRREGVPAGGPGWPSTLAAFGVLTLLILGGLYALKHHDGHLHTATAQRTAQVSLSQGGGTSTASTTRAKKESAPEERLHFRWLPALVIGGTLLGLAFSVRAAARRRRQKSAQPAHQTPCTENLGEVASDSLDDLSSECDARRAVIRAYARMEQVFARSGVPRRQAETPLEYLVRALDDTTVSASSARQLTQLFERAKFSHRVVSGTMKDDAIAALVSVQAELEKASGAG